MQRMQLEANRPVMKFSVPRKLSAAPLTPLVEIFERCFLLYVQFDILRLISKNKVDPVSGWRDIDFCDFSEK